MTTSSAQQWELSNYDRVLRFRGERIAHATNRRGADSDQIRWTEVDVYRTEGGAYVVHKVGKSRVYHAGPALCSATGGRKTTVKQLFVKLDSIALVDLAPCPVCKPVGLFDCKPETQVVVEVDRGVTATSTTAQGVVECAHNQDKDGVTYLTRVAEDALRQASEVDDDVREAYMVEEIA